MFLLWYFEHHQRVKEVLFHLIEHGRTRVAVIKLLLSFLLLSLQNCFGSTPFPCLILQVLMDIVKHQYPSNKLLCLIYPKLISFAQNQRVLKDILPHLTHNSKILWLWPFHSGEKFGTERFNDMPRIPQLVRLTEYGPKSGCVWSWVSNR